ncbi:MAG TPA: deoxynucleoside kinase [Gemmatimonadaceae bacterium]|nr:deoxynucleoside kinase [Gemmatimonadaceae bacterium]
MMIAVAGMVGSGKSTLARALATRFGLNLALESVDDDNPWLPLFYADPDNRKRYALHLQLHFLATRFRSLRQMRGRGGSWVLDRTWYEDAEVFVRGLVEQGLLAPLEHGLYHRLYAELLHAPAARPPRLLIYLYGSLDTIVRRIETRGRPTEQGVEREYWARLHARYREWIREFRHCPVLSLDVTEYDIVGDPDAIEEIASLVRLRLEGELPQTDLWPATPRRARGSWRELPSGHEP